MTNSMDGLAQARLDQLAQGKKDGVELHPGMWRECFHLSRCEDGCCSIEDAPEDCSACLGVGFVANADPMALVKSAAKLWKEVRIDWDPDYFNGALYCVDIVNAVDDEGEPLDLERWMALELDLESALVQAVWEATVAVADNLIKCTCQTDPAHSAEVANEGHCNSCSGTKRVVRA